mgnify:CR=1 FL=1
MQGFFKLPRALFSEAAPGIGLPAKVLYALILDRLSLSEKNGWRDPEGRTFALFSRDEMAATLNISRPTAIKAVKELKEAGMVHEVRQGRNRPGRLYADVKVFDVKEFDVKEFDVKEFDLCSKETLPPVVKNLYPNYTKEQTKEIRLKEGDNSKALFPLEAIPDKPDRVPYSEIMDLYNQHCQQLPQAIKLTDSRRRAIRARWRTCSDLAAWAEYFQRAAASDFLRGQNDRGWRADFDWLLSEANGVKVMEGRYDNRTQSDPIKAAIQRAMAMDEAEAKGEEVSWGWQ